MFRAGIVTSQIPDVREELRHVALLEQTGVGTVWRTSNVRIPDSLTVYAAAAAQTDRIRLGTAIVPIFPRHPMAIVSQALAIDSLAPGRLRLGLGTSHRSLMEERLGLAMPKPLSYLREYLTIVTRMLRDGRCDFDGEFLTTHEELPNGPLGARVEVSMAAQSEKSYELAGELADAAISWVSPVSYLRDVALPAMAASAENAGRDVPTLIAHVPVSVSEDRERALVQAAKAYAYYGGLPFYQKMFERAGYPVIDGKPSAEVIDSLLVSGSADQIRTQLDDIASMGNVEIMAQLVSLDDADAELRSLAEILREGSAE